MPESLESFKKSADKLSKCIDEIESRSFNARKRNFNLSYGENKANYLAGSVSSYLKELKMHAWAFSEAARLDNESEEKAVRILGLIKKAEKQKNGDLSGIAECVAEMRDIAEGLDLAKGHADEPDFRMPMLPASIEPEVKADVRELKRCFSAKCYRSSVILCGRILETALHRKYFEITGNDILETNPGVGLGKLIAKLNDKVEFDPAIKDQIHLVNKVRISSVHKKANVFFPTRQQAYAIILYTADIINKLFR